MKVLRFGFWWLLVPVAILALLLALLLFTTAGARFAATVAERALPELQIEGIDGSLAFGLNAHQVLWKQAEVTVTLDGVAGWWNPRCLLQAQVCVKSLIAGRLHIDVPPQQDVHDDDSDVTPIDLPLLVLPWRLRVEQFHLAELHIQAGGRLTAVSPIAFRAEWQGTRVSVEQFTASTIDPDIGTLDASLTGSIEMASEWPFHAVAKAEYIPPIEGWKAQRLMLSGEGNIRNLMLKAVANAEVVIPQMEMLRFNAEVTSQALDSNIQLQELHGQWNGAPLFAQGGVQFLHTGDLQLQDMQVHWGKNQATLNGWLRERWDMRAMLTLAEPQLIAPDASGQLVGEASITGLRNDPLIDAQLKADTLDLPDIHLREFQLAAQVAPVSLSSLDFHASAVSLHIQENEFHDVNVHLQGDARNHHLELQAYHQQQALQAEAEGSLTMDNLNWHGRILRLKLQPQQDWTIQLQQPVAVDWQNKTQRVTWKHHCFGDGKATLCSQGHVDVKTLKGDVRLDVNEFALEKLNGFLENGAQLQGMLNAQLHVQENLLRPHVQGDLNAGGLSWRGNKVDPPLVEKGDLDIAFSGRQATIMAEMDMPPGLHWLSEGPVVVEWSQDGFALQHSCWNARRTTTEQLTQESLGRLCLQVQTAGKTGLDAQLELNLALAPALYPFLPPTLQVDGTLEGRADAHVKGSDLQAAFQLNLVQGEIRLLREEDRPPIIAPIETLRLQGELRQEVLRTDLTLKSSRLGTGQASANIEIRGHNPQMSAQAVLKDLNLAVVQPLLPQLSELSGAINVDVQAQGAVAAPDINGRVDVRDVQIQSVGVPINIDDMDAALVFTGNRGDLKGQLKSGKGSADLTGIFSRESSGWQSRINLKGRSIPVMQPPDIRFLVHPDLTLLADKDSIDLEGTVLVNQGFLVLKPLPPGAIGVSSDVVFVDERSARLQQKTSLALGVDVVATVEPSLRIRGFGGEIRPKGSVRVQLDRSGVLIGRGTIDIEEGSYTGYGQQLTIRRGQAIFNGPLDEPYINLEAIRQVDNVVAGIRVTGPASEPIASLFSEPTMSDSQILYYIITGKAPGTGTEDEDTAVRNALLSVGLMGGQPFARDIASKVGIDDLQMATTGSGDQTAVTLSGYLNSRTYLQYGISVFQPVNTVTVRYRLQENLFLEAVNGIASALDILYSFEF